MSRKMSVIVGLFTLLMAASLLGACHTTAGAGQDLSAAGHVVTKSADQHMP
jgi:predicted small secreted protein